MSLSFPIAYTRSIENKPYGYRIVLNAELSPTDIFIMFAVRPINPLSTVKSTEYRFYSLRQNRLGVDVDGGNTNLFSDPVFTGTPEQIAQQYNIYNVCCNEVLKLSALVGVRRLVVDHTTSGNQKITHYAFHPDPELPRTLAVETTCIDAKTRHVISRTSTDIALPVDPEFSEGDTPKTYELAILQAPGVNSVEIATQSQLLCYKGEARIVVTINGQYPNSDEGLIDISCYVPRPHDRRGVVVVNAPKVEGSASYDLIRGTLTYYDDRKEPVKNLKILECLKEIFPGFKTSIVTETNT